MSALNDLAARFQERLNAQSDAVARRVVREWRAAGARDLDAAWERTAPTIERVVSVGQAQAAALGAAYASRSLREQDAELDRVTVDTGSLAGVSREGRGVAPELFAAVTTTKRLIGAGSGVGAAFQAGAGVLSVLAANLIRDTGRGAVSTMGAAQGASRTVRVVSPGACSRCAILAGATGLSAFERHPRCRCTNMLIPGGETPAGFFASPADYFESLSTAEQDRVFTKAGAEAIRFGADPIKVVNVRRGATRAVTGRLLRTQIGVRDGEPVFGYVTAERSGRAGSRFTRSRTRRLMPETILELTDDPELRKVLLRDAGYVRPTVRRQRDSAWLAEWRAQQASDRELAEAFYRSVGLR
jgi:hypothetical protein